MNPYFATQIGNPVTVRAFGLYSDGILRPFIPSSWSCLDASVTLTPSSPPDGTCVATPSVAGAFTVNAHWTDPLGKPHTTQLYVHVDAVTLIIVPPLLFLGVTILPQ